MTTTPSPTDLSINAQWAIYYAQRYGWYVFPCHYIKDRHCSCRELNCKNAGKHPLARLAPNGEKSASNDPLVIAAWWTQEPEANIAVATGPSGLCVIDCEADDGEMNFLNWYASRSNDDLPLTLKSRTGGGGSHIFFLANGHDIQSKNRFTELVDIKCRTGYCVLPPSIHRSANRYRWINEGVSPVPIPDLLAEMLIQAKGGALSTVTGHPSYDYNLARVTGPRSGYRDQFFNDYAYAMKKNGWGVQYAIKEIHRTWEKCEQPLDDFYTWETALEKVQRVYEDDNVEPDPVPDWPSGLARPTDA